MQEGSSSIKDSEDFIKKINNLDSILENTIFVTADVVCLCRSMQHEAGLKALRET